MSLQNVVAWTNLGSLYLKKENIEVCDYLVYATYFFCFYHRWMTFILFKCGFIVLACTRGLQDCSVLGATLCQLLDRTGTTLSIY